MEICWCRWRYVVVGGVCSSIISLILLLAKLNPVTPTPAEVETVAKYVFDICFNNYFYLSLHIETWVIR